MTIDITNPIFHDNDKAREHLEALRWPDGPYCPHCGEAEPERITKLQGKSTRPGVHKCKTCRKPFSVTVGTVFERSKVPLGKWVLATQLMASSKKGMSAHQLHRMLGVTYKTAWFMAHRIREAMKETNPTPMGGEGQHIQADETYFGIKDDVRHMNKRTRKHMSSKRSVVSLVSGGKARTFHVQRANAKTVRHILVTNVHRSSELHTDEAHIYKTVGKEFAAHKHVTHSKDEYVGSEGQTTNHVENYFSVFKRGMRGVYQHCSEKHLQRYIDEFDFRFNRRDIGDMERAMEALQGIAGKRLTYRRIGDGANV